MALLWFDGFESYTTAADMGVVNNGVVIGGSYNVNAIDANGRRGSQALTMSRSVFSTWHLASGYTSFIVGFAVYNYGNASIVLYSSRPLIGFLDDGSAQLYFNPTAAGELNVYRGAGTTLLGTTSGLNIGFQQWKFIEVKITIDNSVGSVSVRSNGVSVLELSNIDTKATANNTFDQITIRGMNDAAHIYLDDMYFCDLTGTKNNDFLGDVRVDVLRPDGAGTHTDFTPSAGSNYQNVDEANGPDDDTTYNSGSNVADQDTYNLGALPSPSGTTIHGVKSQITVRKTDAGSRGVKILTIAGTTEDLGAEVSLSDTYTTPAKILEDNPDDSAAWADADVNAMEVGVEITT